MSGRITTRAAPPSSLPVWTRAKTMEESTHSQKDMCMQLRGLTTIHENGNQIRGVQRSGVAATASRKGYHGAYAPQSRAIHNTWHARNLALPLLHRLSNCPSAHVSYIAATFYPAVDDKNSSLLLTTRTAVFC